MLPYSPFLIPKWSYQVTRIFIPTFLYPTQTDLLLPHKLHWGMWYHSLNSICSMLFAPSDLCSSGISPRIFILHTMQCLAQILLFFWGGSSLSFFYVWLLYLKPVSEGIKPWFSHCYRRISFLSATWLYYAYTSLCLPALLTQLFT